MLNTVLLFTLVFFCMKNTFFFINIGIGVAIDHSVNQENIQKNLLLSKEYHYMSQKI